ncbi:DUF262 domain-containing protein [Commensalibacter melissae]|uniref:DUF262 domain-containing protein n=1 Tax=Commensalibacter melissae TaxID=2070537 RepID=UPI0012D86596|nr:DUF262 domain-containing protein [Commensalibacter melissae]MUH03826.1 DUF262 domain-containing protein [Commensalibacter melissae]MUH05596.1 DUF262 domain-containing protein [Commensalibacter melissae]
MAKNIEPNLKNIELYLKLNRTENFLIPEYQRGYSWDIGQCDKLLEDIENFKESESNDPYFFGSIIIDCSDQNQFSLIDGQQRTTTFLLLLKAILLRLNEVLQTVSKDEDSEALIAGLKANRNKIMEILYKAEAENIPSMLKDPKKTQNILILGNKSINELYPEEFNKIIGASDFEDAEEKVFKLPYKKNNNRYTNYFRNFKNFYEKLRENSDSWLNQFTKTFLKNCQVIEIRSWQVEQAITMFNSLNSTGLPLSDADIISAKLYSYAGDKREEFNIQWEEILQLTNKLKSKKVVTIDSVLQQFMYINRAKEQGYLKSYIYVRTPGLRRYYADHEQDLLKNPFLLCNNLKKIAYKWDKIKDYSIIKLLLKCNVNIKLYLAAYLYRFELDEITEDKIINVCESLLKLFSLLELGDAGYSSNKFKIFLYAEIIKMVDFNIPEHVVCQDFYDHIHDKWNVKEVEDAILTYDKNMLVFVNEYLYAKNKNLKFNFSETVNVEHIMPASGRNIETIRHDAKMDKNEFENVINRLGNKILLEENINRSISNEWFKTKKQSFIHNKNGYKNSKYNLAKTLINYPSDKWEKNDILETTEKAAKRISNFIFS